VNFAPGTVVGGKYKILARLGGGGFGTVYESTHPQLERKVALKLLHVEIMDEETSARFLREAHILSTLQHKHVIQFYEYGVWRGIPYFVMEHVQGTSLKDLLCQDELDLPRIMSLMKDVCSAIGYAHENQVVHRDLKPENIIVARHSDGSDLVKVIDFGLAKTAAGETLAAQALTSSGQVVGTIQYMSPEQCVGSAATARSDVYSLGCILYECLAGQPPFDEDDPQEVMRDHITRKPAELFAGADGVFVELRNLVERCLQKEPARRFANGYEVLAELQSLNLAEIDQQRQTAGRSKTISTAPVCAESAACMANPRLQSCIQPLFVGVLLLSIPVASIAVLLNMPTSWYVEQTPNIVAMAGRKSEKETLVEAAELCQRINKPMAAAALYETAAEHSNYVTYEKAENTLKALLMKRAGGLSVNDRLYFFLSELTHQMYDKSLPPEIRDRTITTALRLASQTHAHLENTKRPRWYHRTARLIRYKAMDAGETTIAEEFNRDLRGDGQGKRTVEAMIDEAMDCWVCLRKAQVLPPTDPKRTASINETAMRFQDLLSYAQKARLGEEGRLVVEPRVAEVRAGYGMCLVLSGHEAEGRRIIEQAKQECLNTLKRNPAFSEADRSQQYADFVHLYCRQ
jgi:eukaryotic-like serine/threonine-protein kinase